MTLNKTEVRERALEVAGQLMAAEGGEGLKARAVAKEVGVSVGTIYNIFGDLDDLQRAVNLKLLDALGAASETVMAEMRQAGVTDVRALLIGLARTYFDFVRANTRHWQTLLALNARIPLSDQPDWYADRFDLLFGIIGDVLRATPLGGDDERRNVAAHALWASVHGIVTAGYARRGRLDGETEIWRQVDMLISTFLKGLDRA